MSIDHDVQMSAEMLDKFKASRPKIEIIWTVISSGLLYSNHGQVDERKEKKR